MNAMVTWIGGGTAAVVALFAGATLAVSAAKSQDPAPPAPRIAYAAPSMSAAPVADAAPEPATADASAAAIAPPVTAPAAAPATAPARVQPAAQAMVIKRILPIDGPIRYGDWYWDDKGVPPGRIVITVDLKARVISVFRGGYEIGAAAALLGTPEHPTPTGRFPILTKERHNISEKYNDAPMPWTLRLTWDGVAIHGGGAVENGYASHGCIGVPDGFAAKAFAAAHKGDLVVITNGKQSGMGDRLI